MAEILETDHLLPFDALHAEIKMAILSFKRKTGGNVANISIKWESEDIQGGKMIRDIFIETHND